MIGREHVNSSQTVHKIGIAGAKKLKVVVQNVKSAVKKRWRSALLVNVPK